MKVRRLSKITLVALLVIQLSGCGTLFYPERRGTKTGRLDADVVALDAVGLVFFIIPGMIAFAIDFVTGAIYLPPGERSRLSEMFGDAAPRFEHGEGVSMATIERATARLGMDLDPNTTWVLEAPVGTNPIQALEILDRAARSDADWIDPAAGWRRLAEIPRLHRSEGEAAQEAAARSAG